ncbi:MAG: DUF262 domain-containing protein [Candidatus Kapabacteria bacterium]|nr:DUF262 domain-containing protein [Candidatus Kapabacteria bacterium]
MIIDDLYAVKFREYFLPWLKIELEKLGTDYWIRYVIPCLSIDQRRNIEYYHRERIEELDIRALLRVLDRNARTINSDQRYPRDVFVYLREVILNANQQKHIGPLPPLSDNLRAIDTIRRFAQILKLDEEFINSCNECDNILNGDHVNEDNNYEDDSLSRQITLSSLEDIFDKRVLFRIPDYQRGYSWEDKQIQQLWDDIISLKSNRIHYTGLLTLDSADKESANLDKWRDVEWLLKNDPEFRPFYIVDGQQRISTMILIIHELIEAIYTQDKDDKERNKYRDRYLFLKSQNNIGFKFGYENDSLANSCFTKILNNENDYNGTKTLYIKRLDNARDKIQKLINKKCPRPHDKRNILNILTTRFRFNVFVVSPDLDVSVMFETMNYRGKPLSKLELLKNRLMFLTSVLDEKDADNQAKLELRNKIDGAWKTIYEYLGKNDEEALDDDDFLLNHTYMYSRFRATTYERVLDSLFRDVSWETTSKGLETLEGIYTTSEVSKGHITRQTIELFVFNIKKSVEHWFLIKFPFHHLVKLPKHFDNQQDNNQIKHYLEKLKRLPFRAFDPSLLAVLNNATKQSDFRELLKTMERFLFISRYLIKKPADHKKNDYFRNALSLSLNELCVADLRSIIDRETGKCLKNLKADFSKWIADEFSKDTDKIGFTKWRGLNYVLYEYELYLQQDGQTKIDYSRGFRDSSVEHIYPKSSNNECWTTAFQGSDNRKIKLLHNLGNLLLLSQSKNAALSNRCFDYKKRHKVNTTDNSTKYKGYFNGSYSEINVAQNVEWTAKEIQDRGITILTFIEDHWNINFGDDRDKISILQLSRFNIDISGQDE